MPKCRKYKIVIAEDEALILKYLVNKIKKATEYFEVVATASDGLSALELVKKHLPNVLITDIKMPQMDGLALAENVKDYFPSIQTIVITGHADFEYAKQAIHSNVFEYLLKPVSVDSLNHVFINLLSVFAENDAELLNEFGEFSVNSPEELFDNIKHYITSNYENHFDLYQLAKHFNYSPAYITKVFKKFANTTPICFLTQLRVNVASRMLIETDIPINNIAVQVGYANQFYFSRVFKKVKSISPLDYRHKHKKS